MNKISDGRIEVADDNEPAGHIGTAGEEFNGGEVQNHDEAPVGNGLYHRPFPTSGRLLFCHILLHFVFPFPLRSPNSTLYQPLYAVGTTKPRPTGSRQMPLTSNKLADPDR